MSKKKQDNFIRNAAGDYVYRGKYLKYDVQNPLPYRQYKAAVTLSSMLLAAAVIGAGACNAPGFEADPNALGFAISSRVIMTSAITILYWIAIGCMLLCCWFAGRIAKAGNPIKELEWNANGGPLKIVLLVLPGVCAVLAAVYLINLRELDPQTYNMFSAVSFTAFLAVASIDALMLRSVIKNNIWK